MQFGTVVYNHKIYNLEYMTSDEIKNLLNMIEEEKRESFTKVKKMLKR